MNSLNYLSRQFDDLASPRAPPSTPTSDAASFMLDKASSSHRRNSGADAPLKRTKTWSSRSFLFSRPSTSTHGYTGSSKPPTRSFSTPGAFVSLASMRQAAMSTTFNVPISPKDHLESTLKGIVFIRALVLLWKTLCEAWASLTRRDLVTSSREATVEPGSESDDKDSEDETSDERGLQDQRSSLQVTIPPRSRSQSARLSPIPRHLPRANDHMVTISESNREPDTHLSSPTPITGTAERSRSSTPVLSTRKTPFSIPKTLVLDLDETLIHSTSRPMNMSGSSPTNYLGLNTFGRKNKGAGYTVEVDFGGRSTLYHVYKRPFVDFFLRTVSGWYTLVIFTASMQEYADPVIDWLDAGRGILERRLFRDSCTQLPNGSYTKDLSIVEQDLSRVCLVDNSPVSYRVNEGNGIPIEGWTDDPSDQALLDLLPVLDSLRFTNDVRRVLGIRGFVGT